MTSRRTRPRNQTKMCSLGASESRDLDDPLRLLGVVSMLDRGVLEQLEQDVRDGVCFASQLTQLECILLSLYRKMSQSDQEHIHRIAEMMAQTD